MNAVVTNNECFYKLRGSPKNGLRIIRVPWNKPEPMETAEPKTTPRIQAQVN